MNEFDENAVAEGMEIADDDAVAAGGKGGKGVSPVMMAIMVVIVLAVGVGAHFVLKAVFFSKPPPPKVEKTEGQTAVGEVYQLDGLIVNPRETGGRRHLMIDLGMEVSDPLVIPELEKIDPLLRDNLLTFLSAQKVETLSDIHMREKIRERIGEIVNFYLTTGEVTRVYFIRYVFQ